MLAGSGIVLVIAVLLPFLGPAVARLAGRRRAAGLGCAFGPDAAILERIDTIVLDKDRTVTTGELRVIAVDAVEPDHDRNLRWFAGALEQASDHPVGRAIAALSGRGHLAGVEHHPGRGISGMVDKHLVRVGSPGWIEATRPVLSAAGGLGFGASGARAPSVPQPAVCDGVGTTVAVEVDGWPLGRITVWDRVRQDAAQGIAALGEMGLRAIVLTDDSEAGAARLAALLDGAVVETAADAEERACRVDLLRAEGRVVAYAGPPGVNDEAFEATHLRIGPGTHGGIAVTDPDIARLPAIIGLGRRTVRRAMLARRTGLVAGVVLGAVALGGLTGVLAPLAVVAACVAAVVAVGGVAVS